MRPKTRLSILTGALALAFLVTARLPGQERTKTLQVTLVETPPKIDGQLDDPCWKSLQPVSGFFQYDPVNGVPASEDTQVWAAYDGKHIYFAFLMKDSQPDKIWAELTPRNEFENNDSVTLILDTYNDKRTSITFSVNPRGVQKNSVETIWKSEAVMRADGWSAEMAIPFKSLRFSSDQEQVWGVNFERTIHRLSETDYWTDVDRDLPKLQQSGELRGLAGVRPGYNLEFFPYAGYRTTRWEGEVDHKGAFGMDAKWGIRPNVTLDVTASPDFSEVESDPFIYQLSPYENYFQENRPFFQEGSQYFRLATEDEFHWHTNLNFFYSRRIGNPKFAAKLSGKTGGTSFGLLGAINKEPVGEDAYDNSTFGVVRIQRDIFKNSQVGIYYAGINDTDIGNNNFAVDYSFNFKDFYYLKGMSAFTLNKGAENRRNGIHIVQFRREPDAGLQLTSSFQRIEENVEIRTGFLNQIDIQAFDLMAGYAWRYNKGALQRFSFDITGSLKQDTHGNLTGNGLNVFFWTQFLSRLMFHGGFELGKSKYQIEGEGGELLWTPDFIKTYGGNLDFDWERGGFLKEVSLEGGWGRRGVYSEDFTSVLPGFQTNVEAQLTLRPRSNFQISFSGDYIRQTLDETGAVAFDGLAYETALHYQVTRRLFLNTRLLGETRDKQYNLDFLVGYYFGAGNIVQLSFKKSERSELLGTVGGYSVTLKVSYLLRI